jgi:flavin-dependent dehydrogenase
MLARGGASVSLVHWSGYAAGGVELVSGHARHLIEQHCADFFQKAVPGVEVQATVSLWGTPDPVTFNAMFNPWGAGIALERSLLDQALRDLACSAGVSILADAKTVGVEHGDERGGQWRVRMRGGDSFSDKIETDQVRARFLVLATGRASAQFFNRSPVSEPTQIALMTSLKTKGDKPGHTLYIEAANNGWWYALPARDGGYFVGLCIGRDELKRRQTALRDFFVQELKHTRLLAPLLPDFVSIQPLTGRTAGASVFKSMAGEGWIAVGDAAYAPDPLSGMGIELAVESAQLGARALLEASQRTTECNALTELKDYEDAMRERVSSQEKIAAYHYSRL